MDVTTAQLYDLFVEKGFEKARVRDALSEIVSRAEMDAVVESGFDKVRADLRKDIADMKSELIKIMLVQTGATVAILSALYAMFGGA